MLFVLGLQERDSVIHRCISLLFFFGVFPHIGSSSVSGDFPVLCVRSTGIIYMIKSSVFLLLTTSKYLPATTFYFLKL